MPLCSAKLRNGKDCWYKAKQDGLCLVHWRHPDCPICYEKIYLDSWELECGHRFHESCLKSWFEMDKRSCPMCREDVDESTLDRIGVKISKLKSVLLRLENLMFETTHDEDAMQDRMLRVRMSIIDGMFKELAVRHTIVDYLEVRLSTQTEEISRLSAEIAKIESWESELQTGMSDATDDNAVKLEKMYERLGGLVNWHIVD